MRIGADDPMMSFEHRGVKYRTRDGVAEVPDSVGQRFIENVPGVSRAHGTVMIAGVSSPDPGWDCACGRVNFIWQKACGKCGGGRGLEQERA